MKTERNISPTVLYVILFFIMLLWAGSWVSGKVSADNTEPRLLLFWRFFLTALSYIPCCLIFKAPFLPPKRAWLYLLMAAMLMFGYNFGFFNGLSLGFAGKGGVLVTSLNPLAIFIWSIFFLNQKVGKIQWLGLLVGLAGCLVLLAPWESSWTEIIAGGNLFFLLSSFCWGGVTVAAAKSQRYISVFSHCFWLFSIAAVLSFFYCLPVNPLLNVPAGASFWLNILYLALFCGTASNTIYFKISAMLGSARTAGFIYLVPPSAMLLSWLLLGETPRLTTIVGGAAAILSISIINKGVSGHSEAAAPLCADAGKTGRMPE